MSAPDGIRDILEEALSSAVEEAVKDTFRSHAGVLQDTLLAAFSDPAASMLGRAVKLFIGFFFKKASSIESKLDLLVSESFSTSARTLQQILSIQITNKAEYDECQRQLASTIDNLSSAYSKAENDRRKQQSILVFQSIAFALRTGGKPFMEQCLAELRTVASAARRAAAHSNEEAAALERGDPRIIEPLRQAWHQSATDSGPRLANVVGFQEMLGLRQERLRLEATKLGNAASAIDSFCALITWLGENREEFFKAPKYVVS